MDVIIIVVEFNKIKAEEFESMFVCRKYYSVNLDTPSA